MKPAILTTALAALLLAGSAQAQTRLPTVELTAGMHIIKAEVAARDEDRQQGLMFREKMGPNEGMLFVFEQPQKVCMWMKNTLLPLSVAFADASGRILNIADMKPQTLDSHCANGAASYALEMNQGWFKQKNIKAGQTLGGLPSAAPR